MQLALKASNVALGKACKVTTTTNFHTLSLHLCAMVWAEHGSELRLLTALSMHPEFLISWGYRAKEAVLIKKGKITTHLHCTKENEFH